MIWIHVSLLSLLLTVTLGFYHEKSSVVFKPGNGKPGAFGYSITYEKSTKRLIASDPLANLVGDVYSCDIDKTVCNETVETDIDNPHNKDRKQHLWFGATVKAGSTYFVSCAPLFLGKSLKSNEKRIGVYAQCYKCEKPQNDPTRTHPTKCDNITIYSNDSTMGKFEKNFTTYGWSMDSLDDLVVLGGPASGTGNAVSYDYSGNYKMVSNEDISRSEVKYNFGYSVAIGQSEKNKSIAISSTYGYGTVAMMNSDLQFLYSLSKGYDDLLVGSMYGAALCSASLKGYKQDFLVGAPGYALDHLNNVGAVYVYLYDGSIPVYSKTIKGYTSNSFFGSAIVSLGDLDHDKKDEIAIAAPYENDNRGAVYIYSGKEISTMSDDVAFKHKIEAEPNWISFGLSLTVLDDYDENGCNELAIGAPETNVVRLFKCFASIVISVYAEKQITRTGPNTNLKIKSCFNVTFPEKPKVVKATIKIQNEVLHQDAKLAHPKTDSTYKIVINKPQEVYCKDIDVFTPVVGKYDESIDFVINAALAYNPLESDSFDASEVLLSQASNLTHHEIVYIAECNEKCMPDIRHVNTDYSTKIPYLIGSTSDIRVNIETKNVGDIAYDACVSLNIKGAPVKLVPHMCERDDTTLDTTELKCAPIQLLRTNLPWNIKDLLLDTSYLTNADKEILIVGTIYNHCKEQSNGASFKSVIKLIHDKGNGVYIMESTGVDNSKEIEHRYQILNVGPTIWKNVKLTLKVDKQFFFTLDDISLQVGINSECKNIKEDNTQYLFSCKIEKISKKMPIPVLLGVKINQGSIGSINTNGNLTVSSQLSLDFDGTIKSKSLVSNLKHVPLWVLIAAGGLGLIILLILIFILRERGCLQRKNKQQLEQVRKSVRRQTVIRRSLNRSRQPSQQEELINATAEMREELQRNIEKRNADKKDNRIHVDQLD